LRDELVEYKGWEKVDELGFLNRDAIKKLFSDSLVGLVTLLPTINYIESLPVKMFEYMSAGIAVIASNFPVFKKIVEDNQCGICVDPNIPNEISAAIDYLVTNSNEAYKMGENGKRAVEEKYQWALENKKLLDFYKESPLIQISAM
jgi:glycosyltransferase involved in cell wall biosynthesis